MAATTCICKREILHSPCLDDHPLQDTASNSRYFAHGPHKSKNLFCRQFQIRDFLSESLDMVDHPSSSGYVDRALNELDWKAVKKFWKYPSGILLQQLDSSRYDFCDSAAMVLKGTARITLFITTH